MYIESDSSKLTYVDEYPKVLTEIESKVKMYNRPIGYTQMSGMIRRNI